MCYRKFTFGSKSLAEAKIAAAGCSVNPSKLFNSIVSFSVSTCRTQKMQRVDAEDLESDDNG